MVGPHVVVRPPAGWVNAELDRPTIAESSGAAYSEWTAWRTDAPADALGERLVHACVATPIPGWVEDMRPAVEARTHGLTSAQANMITGAPAELRGSGGEVLEIRRAGESNGPALGRARTFVGFDGSHVFTCFAVCARKGPGPADDACGRSVTEARLEGSLEPPRPGTFLRGATWAVHHPRAAALGGAGLILALGILAITARRRPRSTIVRIR